MKYVVDVVQYHLTRRESNPGRIGECANDCLTRLLHYYKFMFVCLFYFTVGIYELSVCVRLFLCIQLFAYKIFTILSFFMKGYEMDV